MKKEALNLETGYATNLTYEWKYYIFTKKSDPNFRVEFVAYNDNTFEISNEEVTSNEFYKRLSNLLLSIVLNS